MSGLNGIGNQTSAELKIASGMKSQANAPLSAISHPEADVNLGEAAKGLAAATDSEVRVDKVASIRASIEGGTYSAPASAVAAKIIDSMISGVKSERE